jgi:hypothetical protein
MTAFVLRELRRSYKELPMQWLAVRLSRTLETGKTVASSSLHSDFSGRVDTTRTETNNAGSANTD